MSEGITVRRQKRKSSHTKWKLCFFLTLVILLMVIPPGFRSGSLLLSALSFLGYAFLLFLCLNIQVTDATPLRLIVNRIGATIAFFSCVLFTGNYLNVQSKFFLTRRKNLILRILGIVIVDIVLFFCVVAVVSMLESFVL